MLHVIYRSYGGENLKDRPEYYNKLVSLLSFVRAAERAGVEPIFLNDGPIPEDRLRVMQDAGSIVELPSVGMRGSYTAALRHAIDGNWDRDDVVWFAEDDYLYRPEALQQLEQAVTAVPEADYFALYASTPAHPARGVEPPLREPRGWQDRGPWRVDGQDWVRVQSTTSTFGGRIGALAEDFGIFRFCMVPHKTMLRDHDTCLLVQGCEPYSYAELARTVVGLSGGTPKERLRGVVMAPFLLATNLRSHRRPTRRRLMVAADPNLASHMETPLLSPGTDWSAVAEDTLAWAATRSAGTAPPTA